MNPLFTHYQAKHWLMFALEVATADTDLPRDVTLAAQQAMHILLEALEKNDARRLWENIGLDAGYGDVPKVAQRRK